MTISLSEGLPRQDSCRLRANHVKLTYLDLQSGAISRDADANPALEGMNPSQWVVVELSTSRGRFVQSYSEWWN